MDIAILCAQELQGHSGYYHHVLANLRLIAPALPAIWFLAGSFFDGYRA